MLIRTKVFLINLIISFCLVGLSSFAMLATHGKVRFDWGLLVFGITMMIIGTVLNAKR